MDREWRCFDGNEAAAGVADAPVESDKCPLVGGGRCELALRRAVATATGSMP